ncbi:phosphotransferase family protein [Mycetocola sp. 2940]|uniref:phosphotransferase family protein n=1 Tax=Mycetocola sp. 2940 TaxID=3156452 RepID=UPI00339A7355
MTATALPGLDPHNLREYLRDSIPGAGDEPLSAVLLAGGRSNVSYLIEQGSRRLVLRRPPLGNILPSAHDMGREFRLLSGMGRVQFPAPAAVALCEDTAVIGAPFMLMEFVEGEVIATAEEAALLTPAQADAVSSSLVTTLARLHGVDVQAAGLENLGRPEGYLVRQVVRWSDQWQRTKTRELDDMDALSAWLGERVGQVRPDAPWSIVHGDYRIDNVILDPTDHSVRAVLDWEMSTLGDPVSDLAISLVYWSEAADVLRQDIPVSTGVTAGAGFWTRERIVEEYADQTGFDLGHLDTCVALACFKLAVIMESIHKRTRDGQQLGTASTDDGAMGVAATALARLGRSVTDGGEVAALGR